MINGGFKLGSRTAAQLGIRMLRASQRPILPGTIDRTLAVPGRSGELDFGADMGPRPFALECAMVKRDPTSLQQAVSQLAAFLHDQYGRPRTLQLIFDAQPDRYYNVRYSGNMPIDRIVGLGQFTLPLTAFDPHAYSIDGQVINDSITTSPWELEVDSTGTVITPTYIELTNQGTTTINEFTLQAEFLVEV